MPGTGDGEGFEGARESDCSFVWDDNSNLYFHASSGFYHDPNAGWFYSSRDGRYYAFEGGTYVPLTFDGDGESDPHGCKSVTLSEHADDKQRVAVEVSHNIGEECRTGDDLQDLRPPSEWLEETLIDLYLSGHPNAELNVVNLEHLQFTEEEQDRVICEGSNDQFDQDKFPPHHQYTQVEEERVSADVQDTEMLMDTPSGEEASLDEEKWQAQYGQVVQSTEAVPQFPVIDLWDWEMVLGSGKNGDKVRRLSGRLVRSSSKLHPSVPSGGARLKTAAIHDVYLDLVRVASGKVYKLRTPSKRYLTSLSSYDSSNPTKDWGFPDFLIHVHNNEPVDSHQIFKATNLRTNTSKESSRTQIVSPVSQKQQNLPYRDRAAERRALHGEFGIGPGQKNYLNNSLLEGRSTSDTFHPELAAAEAMNMTFGKGSYARRVLEKMGWKDGEALGSTTKGILEPLQAVANKGCAGLGWDHTR